MDNQTSEKKVSKFYLFQVVILLLACLLITLIYTLTWTFVNMQQFSVDYEGHVLWACLKLSQFENIYSLSSLSHKPWSVIIYNPLYFAMGAVLIAIFGVSYEPLRMLSMGSALISFVAFGILLKRCRLNDFHTILVVALLAGSLPVIHWSSVARVDFLGLAFALLSLERFAKTWSDFFQGKALKVSIGAIVFSLCAVFTKQQYFLFLPAYVLFAFCQKQKRLGLLYLAIWSTLMVVIGCILQFVSQGGWWAHLTYAAGLPWEWTTLATFIVPFVLDPKTIISAVVILVATFFKSASEESERDTTRAFEQLALISFLISLTLALYTMGLRGAFHNHLLCTQMTLFWLVGLMLGRLPQTYSLPLIVALLLSLDPLRWFGGDLWMRYDREADTKQTISMLKKISKDRLVLSEDPSLAIFANATPAVIDATTLLNMSSVHPQDLSALLGNLNQKKYSAVIINTHDARRDRGLIWRGPVLKAILENYHFAGKSGGNGMAQSVYLPN
ncbi:MAG: hypothetical protein KIT34_01355 [Cyanobacteria bacterium TGS_CYA1]|nr:hypothetical protein [Cyanobacteria bacterium TGS_CYA1]